MWSPGLLTQAAICLCSPVWPLVIYFARGLDLRGLSVGLWIFWSVVILAQME